MESPSLDIEHALHVAEEQVRRLVTDYPVQFPTYTQRGKWHFEDDPWAPVWTGGFLAGQLWIFAELSGEEWWRNRAEQYSLALEPRKTDAGTHDIGFLFDPSWGRWHALDASARTTDVLVQAGRTMAGRFNPNGHYLRTWVDAGSTFIDVMMNIGVIFRAAALSGDEGLRRIAVEHALTTRKFLVRGDATTVHEGWFDPRSGQFLHAATHQGFRSDSCWARGLAWGIYGFGTAFQGSGDSRFLTTARSLADTYVQRTGTDYIPPNDWDDPRPVQPYESSAAAIAASGMLQLAELCEDDGAEYARYAVGILTALTGSTFLADPDREWEGVLRHATYHHGNGLGVDESVMWGDYYFTEALWRLASSPSLRTLAGFPGGSASDSTTAQQPIRDSPGRTSR
ncbi:glycosyl hydrolase [Microbacterium soli]|uniref:Glycoside hydrolase family 88 protein n=1 Tax=Microbacterium soli TaxID=446075 RepID=A0ABP7MZA5_9MICO